MAQDPSLSERERLGRELFALRGAALSVARRVLGDMWLAEDACAESYLRAVKSIESLNSLAELRPWFMRVVVNTARSQASSEAARRRREERAMRESGKSEGTGQLDEVARKELAHAASEELQALDEKQRLALSLHYESGLSHSEVAGALDVPVGTASSDISRGLEELRSRLRSRGVAVAPAVIIGVLTSGSGLKVPAALSSAIEGTISGGLGIKAATLSATAAAGGAALAWKVLSGAAAAALAGLGTWGGVRALSSKPILPAVAPAAPETRNAPKALPQASITLNARGHLSRVLGAVHKQAAFRWAIPSEYVVGTKWHDVALKGVSTKEALEKIADKWGMTWRIGPGGTVLFNLESPDYAERLKEFKASAGKNGTDRAQAVYRLGALGDLRALPHLARAMEEESLLSRCWAAEALRRHLVVVRQGAMRPSGRYAGRILELEGLWLSADQRKALVSALLKEDVVSKAEHVIWSKRRLGQETRLALLACLDDDPRAAAALSKALNDEDPLVFQSAASAVALSGKDRYLKKLLATAEGADRNRARSICNALRAFKFENARKAWLKISLIQISGRGHVAGALGPEDSWAAEELLRLAEHPDVKPGLKSEAIAALGKVADPKAENAAKISKTLAGIYRKDPKGWGGKQTLATLAKYGQPEGRDVLLHALDNAPNGYSLCGVLRAVSEWPESDEKLAEKVLEIAESKKPEWTAVRGHARKTLAAIGGGRGVEFLKRVALERHEVRPGIRRPAPPRNYVYLSFHPGGQAVAALREMDSPKAREALAEIRTKTKDPLLAQQLRFEALSALSVKKATEELVALIQEIEGAGPKEPQLRPGTFSKQVQALAKRGGEHVEVAFRKLALSEVGEVRQIAVTGMGSHPGAGFKDDLLKLGKDADEKVARAAWGVLLRGYLRKDEGRRLVMEALKGRDHRVRDAVLWSLRWGRLSPFDPERDRKPLEELAKLGGPVGEFALAALNSVGTPRGVGESVKQLEVADQKARFAARSGLLNYGFDPRVPPALAAHRKIHPEDYKLRVPGRRPAPPQAEPAEVF